ncbi:MULTISPECIES: hypothetical protein [Sphingobium]|jgi:hypothetical protein|uniref:DUF1795 domain-containing protein n=1 Tax=Sphingobium soli TaxID=1591116 RepID=A0ABS8GYE3_9SPHN|nr:MULTISPECIES: hypothetical protein [Sphingobium]MAP44123.1 hypothetical protein [Sphingobium sp.]MEC9016646.1 hypothetical protein [Pseudomonadota bacterium]MAX15934.1 hypothetical protein [Sphingobium sp.]MBA37317.1 hypothetical protein [Sphingobium sp.]MBA38673.1 hypothetical protein [Sphingobium sp.]|tara:strand:+ start:1170 stop:1796 length:627 start_codon:yes stop_codon:yes gene_type:complete
MKHAPLIACLPILLLAACGRTEPVADMPSQEELAAAANAAAANALESQQADESADSRNYVNLDRGFSVTLPEGWVMDKGASNDDGVVYEDPGAGADVRVFWQKNEGDETLQQTVEALNSSAEGVDGDFVGDSEYRGTANDGEGNNVAVRLLRQPDGAVVTATFVYPEMLSEQYQGIAEKLLDSLRVFAPREASDQTQTPAAAANAAQP